MGTFPDASLQFHFFNSKRKEISLVGAYSFKDRPLLEGLGPPGEQTESSFFKSGEKTKRCTHKTLRL